MTETVVGEVKQEEAKAPETPEVTEEQVVELSPTEQQAIEQGWVPKDQWKGDPEEWRPAKEFVERGELYKSIHELKRKDKQREAAVQALQRHHEHVFNKAYEQAMRDLKAEKRMAIREQDFEKLEEVETKIENLQTNRESEVKQLQVVQAATTPPVDPVFQAFLNKNTWYETDDSMKLEADIIGGHYMNKGGTKEGLFTHVENEMKKRYPEKFGPVRKAAPNAVASVDRTNKKAPKGDLTMNDVPESQRGVIRQMAAASGVSEADYIKELKRIGAL